MGESDYQHLKDIGVKFQLNLFALIGSYGLTVKKKAEWLLKNNLYDLIGSDTHSHTNIEETIYMEKLLQTDKVFIRSGNISRFLQM